MKQIFMLCNNCLEKAFAANNWLVDSQRCTCIWLEPMATINPVENTMELYTCSVNKNDQLTAYVTDLEHPPKDEFALVMTNANEEKISVVLSRDDAYRLHRQLDLFLNLDN